MMSFRKIPPGKCAQFDAYIKRICLNEAAKATRTIRRRYAREGVDANIIEIADSRLDHDAEEPLPDTIRIGGYVFEIRKSCLYDALILLNESELIVILLYYWEELNDRKIGGILGITYQAVNRRRARGIEKLRKITVDRKEFDDSS